MLSGINIFPVAEHSLFTLQLNGTNENAMLVCSATGEYPPITNISLLKNGDVITSAILVNLHCKSTQQTFPDFNRYRLYVCLIDFSGFPLQQSVVLERRSKNISVNIECRSKY